MTKRSGAEVLAEMLQGYGVTHVFMVPSILRRALVEMERRTTIRRIQVHAEKSAAYMADGYARASGRPGICMAQVVGALNLAAGLRDAWLANTPVIAMTGGRDPHTKFRKAYQDLDDVPAFEPVTKFNATVDEVTRIPDLVRQAFRVAVSGKPGPVHLQFRGNEGQIDYEEAEMEPLAEELFARVPPFRPPPAPEHARAALDAIEAAERPVFVAGGGVRASGAGAALVALAERLAVPVATSLHGKDTITGDHPLSVGVVGTYSRETANRVVSEADLVCFVGSETGGMTTHFWQVPPIGTPAVQIDIEPQSLGRNYPLEGGGLRRCQDGPRLDAGPCRSPVGRAPHGLGRPRPPDRGGVARALSAAIWNRMPCPSGRSASATSFRGTCRKTPSSWPIPGHSGMWMGGMYDLRSPRQSYIRSAGHLGWAFPAGLGAKCAAPERPVFVFTGDAGFWYHLGEIETAARCGINTVTLVNNNSSGNQGSPGFDPGLRRASNRSRGASSGPTTTSTSPPSPRPWGRWACASRTPPTSPARLRQPSLPTARR